VVLSEHDEMIPVQEVARDCLDHGVGLLVLPGLRHGFELFRPGSRRRIVNFFLGRHKEPEPKQQPHSLMGALWSSAGSCF